MHALRIARHRSRPAVSTATLLLCLASCLADSGPAARSTTPEMALTPVDEAVAQQAVAALPPAPPAVAVSPAERLCLDGPNGILPSGNAGNIINVAGTQIRLIGGRVVDGAVKIGSASRKGLP